MAKLLEVEDGLVYDGKFYFIERSSLCVFYIKLDTGEIIHLSNIPIDNKQYCFSTGIFGRGMKLREWNNKLVVFSGIDQRIWLYDMKSLRWDCRNIEFKHQVEESYKQYFCVEIYEDKIYIFGCKYGGFIIYDLITDEYKEIEYSYHNSDSGRPKRYLFRYGCTRIGNTIYGLSDFNGPFLEFSTETEEDRWLGLSDVQNVAKNVTEIIQELPCTQIKNSEYSFWYKDSKNVVFQDADKTVHYIEVSSDVEKLFYCQIDETTWGDYWNKYYSKYSQFIWQVH